MAENNDPNSRADAKPAQLSGFVGLSNLPNQVHRKSVKKGFNFTLMVVGESGLGKSTLINTLFNTDLYPERQEKELTNETPKTVAIQTITSTLTENNVTLTLSIIDTPGFGDYLNNDQCWAPILENLDARFDSYLEQENRVNRKKIVDNRVHACLYFIAPSGHSLKPIDVEFMKRLHTRVNIIPVIAKADILTEEEITAFKGRIMESIQEHGIKIFMPVTDSPFDDDESRQEAMELVSKMPFAVVGGTQEVQNADGKTVRGRQYPWGVIEVDNEEHNDFVKLRQMLIRSHMEELKETTNHVLYENYRAEKLLANDSAPLGKQGEINPLLKFEDEKAAHDARIAKLEAEMTQVFQVKVAEKEARMKQNEEELYAKHKETREALERKRAELEEKKRRLEAQIAEAAAAEAAKSAKKTKKKLWS